MSGLITIARPYAQALYDTACRAGINDSVWRGALDNLAVIAANTDVRTLLMSPNVADTTRLACFTALIPELPVQLKAFLQLLIVKKRLLVLKEISVLFGQFCDRDAHQLHVKLYTAKPAAPDFIEQLVQHLSKRLCATVQIDTEVDAALLGGGVLKIGDDILDASLRTQLNRLAEHLTT